MSLLDIHVLGSPVLREVTRPVPEVSDDIRRLIDDMFETMYAAQGIGLAAPQVGRTERVAIVDADERQIVLVNPEIVVAEGKMRGEEGCLSIPDVYAEVDRAQRIVFRALDREGREFEMEAVDLVARALQHEIDHLHGKLFIDYLSILKRRSLLSKWNAVRERYAGNLRKLSPAEVATHHHRDEEL